MNSIEIIKDSSFFKGVDRDKIKNILNCINYQELNFNKNVYLYDLSKGFKTILLIEGMIDLLSIDIDGTEIIDNRFISNESIVYDFGNKEDRFLKTKTPVSLIHMDTSVIFEEKNKACIHRASFMENIIKNLNKATDILSFKAEIYSKKSLRDKILLFLKHKAQNSKLELIYNREDLSKYLACNRSALSRELSQMKKDGIITIKDNILYLNINL